MKVWKWEIYRDESLEYETTETGDDGCPICPNCGKETREMYGTVDQDFMGNDIRGWWYSCFKCEISTPVEYE